MKVSIWGFKMRLVWLIYDNFWQNCSLSKVTMRKNCITFGRLRRQIYGVLNSVSRKTRIHKIIKNTDSKVENNSFKMRHFWALHDYFWPSWAHDTCFFYTLYLYSTSLHKTVYQFLFSNTTIYRKVYWFARWNLDIICWKLYNSSFFSCPRNNSER